MCGRFSIHLVDLDALRLPLGVKHVRVAGWTPRYNVAPSQDAPVVVAEPERTLELLRWGLPARRGREAGGDKLLINARIETAAELPSFREAMRARRCVVPVTGFYEWQVLPGRRSKQPLWIHPRDGGVLALAGLWQPAHRRADVRGATFAIVTRDAAGFARAIHDRMPVDLRGRSLDAWLDPASQPETLVADLAGPEPSMSHLEAVPVGTGVNTPAHDEPDCIAPLAAGMPADPQLDLFGR